jgi:hypothetical protein
VKASSKMPPRQWRLVNGGDAPLLRYAMRSTSEHDRACWIQDGSASASEQQGRTLPNIEMTGACFGIRVNFPSASSEALDGGTSNCSETNNYYGMMGKFKCPVR